MKRFALAFITYILSVPCAIAVGLGLAVFSPILVAYWLGKRMQQDDTI
jgi:hypothetical protein